MTLATYAPLATRALPYTETPLELDAVQGVIRGYVFIWGDAEHKDAYSTFFDRTRPVDFGGNVGDFRRPLSLEHNDYGIVRIGETTRVWFDETGLRFEAQLDRNTPYFPDVVRLVNEGRLATSSGTAEHTADFYDDGAFKSWWIVELALTEKPAERRMPLVQLVRSAEGANDLSRAEAEANDAPPDTPFESEPETPMEEPPTMTIEELLIQAQEAGISLEELLARLQEMQAPAEEPEMEAEAEDEQVSMSVQAPRSAPKVSEPTLSDLFKQLEALKRNMQAAPAKVDDRRKATKKTGEGVNVNTIEARRYANVPHHEMFLIAEIMRQNGKPLSEPFIRALAHRGLDFAQKDKTEDQAVSFIRSMYTRVDDFMATDISGQGQDWVGTFYGADVWQKARTQPIMDALLSKGLMEIEVPDGYSQGVVPLETTDPTVYTTSQANDTDSTGRPEITVNIGFAGTSNVTVTPGELTTAIAHTDILMEDALLSGGIARQLNYQINQVMIRQPEYVFVTGDTETAASTNINLIDGTPGTGRDKPAYMVSNGALKLALVTNSAQSRDGGALDDDDFRLTKQLLSGDARSNLENIAFIVDPDTYDKALSILSLKTRDVAGADATLFTGKLPPLHGVEILRSGQMAKANTAGKISATAGNNTLGRILAVYAPDWAMVWKRRLRFETERYATSGTNVIVAAMRLAFRYRATNASAVSYNLTLS